jgi:hypothetical protein
MKLGRTEQVRLGWDLKDRFEGLDFNGEHRDALVDKAHVPDDHEQFGTDFYCRITWHPSCVTAGN